jgi:hypothetical protein
MTYFVWRTLKRSTSDKVRQFILEHFVFFMGFDNGTHEIISKNDKLSFFETFVNWHSRGNVKKNNEINFRAIIRRAIKHRGSQKKRELAFLPALHQAFKLNLTHSYMFSLIFTRVTFTLEHNRTVFLNLFWVLGTLIL